MTINLERARIIAFIDIFIRTVNFGSTALNGAAFADHKITY